LQTNTDIGVNRKYKDTLFRFLFGRDKKNALSLYNAINHSSYTEEDDLEYTTLDDVIYMKFKNDVSFLIGKTLNLYEHQSSYNPNMPLRGFLYYADLYRQLLPETERLYGRSLVRIPTPRYVVFYNGSDKDMAEEIIQLRLSDAFETEDAKGAYEWTATMVNINCGRNKELLQKCRPLFEYSVFIGKVKKYRIEMEQLNAAVHRAVEECIRENILKDILEKHRREVYDMCLTEFDEQKYEDIVKEEAREEGLREGREEGLQEGLRKGREDTARSLLKSGKLSEAEIAECTELPLEIVQELKRKMEL